MSFGILIVLAIVFYLVVAYPFYLMGQKIGSANAWWAFVPILNILLMLEIAGKELWWIVLFFIPIVNFVAMIIVFMAVAERMGKPSWMGILMIVPIANLIIPWVLAMG